MTKQVGGRKALMALAILVTGVGVTFYKGDIPTNLLMLLQTLFGAFVLGNGVEHVAGAVRKSEQEEVTTSPNDVVVTAVEEAEAEVDRVAEVEQTTEKMAAQVDALQKALGQIVMFLNKEKAPATSPAAKNREALNNLPKG